jgi:hypothetical protein
MSSSKGEEIDLTKDDATLMSIEDTQDMTSSLTHSTQDQNRLPEDSEAKLVILKQLLEDPNVNALLQGLFHPKARAHGLQNPPDRSGADDVSL